MITLHLNHHDFLYAVEGFARGSHLRQHVWKDIVYKSIPQMDNDDMDFLWFYMRRDLYDCFVYDLGDKKHHHVGYEDFMHALAALHRGNRYEIEFLPEGKKKTRKVLAYRFDGHYKPLFVVKEHNNGLWHKELQSYDAYIPDEWIKTIKQYSVPENRYVEQGKEQWWNDLTIYDTI